MLYIVAFLFMALHLKLRVSSISDCLNVNRKENFQIQFDVKHKHNFGLDRYRPSAEIRNHVKLSLRPQMQLIIKSHGKGSKTKNIYFTGMSADTLLKQLCGAIKS